MSVNNAKGEFAIELGSQTLALKYDWAAVAQLQQQTGKPIGDMLQSMGVVEVQAAIYVGLMHLDPRNIKKMTPKKIAKKLDIRKFTYYTEVIVEALSFALGLDLDDEDDSSASEDEEEDGADPLEGPASLTSTG